MQRFLQVTATSRGPCNPGSRTILILTDNFSQENKKKCKMYYSQSETDTGSHRQHYTINCFLNMFINKYIICSFFSNFSTCSKEVFCVAKCQPFGQANSCFLKDNYYLQVSNCGQKVFSGPPLTSLRKS